MPGRRVTASLAAWLSVLGLVLPWGALVLAASPITIVVDGVPVPTPDVPPVIEGGRVLVPIRFVAEAMGFAVDWDPHLGAELKQGTTTIQLFPGVAAARVNGRAVYLDVAPKIVSGRLLVPVRFVAEATGARVAWDDVSRSVTIASPVAPPGPVARDLATVPLGLPEHEAQALWAEPRRRFTGAFGIRWWVYEPDDRLYLRFGFYQGKLVAAYATGEGWRFGQLNPTHAPDQALRALGVTRRTTVQVSSSTYTFDCSPRSKNPDVLTVAPAEKGLAVVYADWIDNRTASVLFVDREYFLSSGGYSRLSSCLVSLVTYGAEAKLEELQRVELQEVYREEAYTLFELANLERRLRGIGPLRWDEGVAAVAEGHSRYMLERDYYGHWTPDTGGPCDRLTSAGVRFRGCGENIAMGYVDDVSVHHGWMNSPGHRETILNPRLDAMGAGVAGAYYTENFIISR